MLLPILAAIASAVALAVGTQQQSKAARENSAEIALHARGWILLITRKRWLLGLLIQGVAIALSIWALAHAPLTIVQPIGALSLVVTTLLNAADRRLAIPKMTWTGVVLATAGSLGFVVAALAAVSADQYVTAAEEHSVIIATVIVLSVSVLVFIAQRKKSRALSFILIAGVLYGFVAVLIRLFLLRVDFTNPQWARSLPWWIILAIAVTAAFGWFLIQQAYLHGPPDLVIAGLTVIDPMVGVLIGIILLGELSAFVPVGAMIGMVGAALVAMVGVFVLAKSHPESVSR